MSDMAVHDNTPRQRLVIRTSRYWFAFAIQNIDEPNMPVNFTLYSSKPTMSVAANLREAFKTLDILNSKFSKVVVMVDEPLLTVPLDLYNESEAAVLYAHSYPDSTNASVMANIIDDLNVAVIFSISKDLQTVINDRFGETIIFHASTPVWRNLFHRSFLGSRNKLYAYFHAHQRMELVSYGTKRFKYCNVFDTSNAHDALYFILSVWRQLSMQENHDELHLVGDIPEAQWLEAELKSYLKRVYTINPSSDFNRSPITKIKEMPYDMMTYFIKGR